MASSSAPTASRLAREAGLGAGRAGSDRTSLPPGAKEKKHGGRELHLRIATRGDRLQDSVSVTGCLLVSSKCRLLWSDGLLHCVDVVINVVCCCQVLPVVDCLN